MSQFSSKRGRPRKRRFGVVWWTLFAASIILLLRNPIAAPSHDSTTIVKKETVVEETPLMLDFDPVETFHIPAYNRIRELINNETIISWGFKKEVNMLEEFNLENVLSSLPIQRLHGRTTEVKKAIWQNRSRSSTIAGHDDGVLLLWETRICKAIKIARRLGSNLPSHVLFTRCDENFGDFSRPVADGKTADWDLPFEKTGCASDDDVYWYLDQKQTNAIFTTQHQFLDHPKVHSLPLGIKYTMKSAVLEALREPRVNKTQLLMINDSGWKHRKAVTETVLENFKDFSETVQNSYVKAKSSSYLEKLMRSKSYFDELKRSKFILAPSGLGWDSYRIWEALHLNTIPIIERYYRPHDGWRRTLDGLPVLWVEDLRNVTPSVLEQAYIRITRQGADYEYEKLTSHWWESFVLSQF